MTMKKRLVLIGLSALTTVAVAGPAYAQAQPSVTYYFKCMTESKVENLHNFLDATYGLVVYPVRPSWTTVRPTRSFLGGAGCGFFDPPLASEAHVQLDAMFGGAHTGAVVAANVELHNLVTSRARAGDSLELEATLSTVNLPGGTWKSVVTRTVAVKPTLSSTGASETVKFTLDGFSIPAVTGDRLISLSIATRDAMSSWVYDAAEVPAGIELIPPEPTAAEASTGSR